MKAKAKKQLVAAIVAGLTLAAAAPAFAAANPFVDVPAKHWAYDSVAKLAAAGIVDGYGDGTFRGDRTMTRYEMAQIVAKAMARADKADAEQKAEIDRLEKEFGDELNKLGVRVSNLEKKIGNITWTGQVREWYEHVDDSDHQPGNNALRTRILLWANAPLANNLNFTGRLWAESEWGKSDNGGWNNGSGTGADVSMDEAYLTYKKGNTTANFGRMPITLGQGLVYNMGPNNDGATVTFGSDQLKLTAAAFRSWAVGLGYDPTMHSTYNLPWSLMWHAPISQFYGPDGNNPNMIAANLDWQPNKDLDVTLVYAKNRDSSINITPGNYYHGFSHMWWHGVAPVVVRGEAVNTWALGTTYKGIKNFTLTAEYGQNRSDFAKMNQAAHTVQTPSSGIEGYDTAKAWVAQLKYKGAQWDKPKTYGVWVGYRHADPGFLGVTGDPLWETPSTVPPMNDVKGFDAGFDYTLFKNGVFTFNYYDLESVSNGVYNWDPVSTWAYWSPGQKDYKSIVAQLRYFF